MAAKRRKKKMKKNQVQVPFPVVLANVLVLVAVLGLSYMWLCSRCDALGKEIKRMEAEFDEVDKRYKNEQEKWSSLTSPPNLADAIRKHGLNMVMPSPEQNIRVNYQYLNESSSLALRK